jgi:hypothetical protein
MYCVVSGISRYFVPRNDKEEKSFAIMSFPESLETAKECHYLGVCHAERSEASRSLSCNYFLTQNEILRRFTPQNDI